MVALYFPLLSYHSILRDSIDQKHAKTNEIWRQNSEIHFRLFSLASMISKSFQTVRRMREAWKGAGAGQSNISTSGEERFKYPLPWENKISQMPYPKANKDNQIPTPRPDL